MDWSKIEEDPAMLRRRIHELEAAVNEVYEMTKLRHLPRMAMPRIRDILKPLYPLDSVVKHQEAAGNRRKV